MSSIVMPRRLSALVLASLVLLLIGCPSSAEAQNLNEAVGFTPNHMLSDDGSSEFIDHQNGVVNLSVPIGPVYRVGPRLSYQLRLTYASYLWQVRSDGGGATSHLIRDGAYGLGWDLHLGRIEEVQGQTAFEYHYISPDGSRHPIGDSSQLPGTTLTIDGTYIKAVKEGVGQPTGWILYFPDATKAHFSGPVTNPATLQVYYRLDTLSGPEADSSGNPWAKVQVTYGSGDTARCISTITDTLGRTIVFNNTGTTEGGRTLSIQQPALNGTTPATATWYFVYASGQTVYSPDPSAPPGSVTGRAYLQTVKYPGPSQKEPLFEFTYNMYGMLERRYFPREADETLGSIHPYFAYTYTPNTFYVWQWPGGGYPAELGAHQGRVLASKALLNGGASTWSWTRLYDSKGNATEVQVRDPDLTLTIYRFQSDDLLNSTNRWRAGLPTATEWYVGNTPAAYKLLRQETRDYQIGAYFVGPPYIAENIELISQTSFGEGDGEPLVPVILRRRDIDAYGRARHVEVEAPGRGLYKRTTTAWTAPSASYWFLGAWTNRTVYDALGRAVSRQDATFRASGQGQLQQTVSWAVPGGVANTPDDVVVTNTYDIANDPNGKGLVTSIRTARYDANDPNPYEVGIEYQDENQLGTTYVARTRPVHPSGDGGPSLVRQWYSQNRDFDRYTGLPLRTLDPNDEAPDNSPGTPGHPGGTFTYDTEYEWDVLGRLTKISPPGEAATQIEYTSLFQTTVKRCVTISTDCRETIYLYDRLGRLIDEHRRAKDGTYDARQTVSDWAGRVVQQTEWFPLGAPPSPMPWTLYDYKHTPTQENAVDPFGRLWKVTTPGGDVTTFTHTDLTRTATVTIDGQTATTKWTYDAFGRLAGVDAPQGADAVYSYDTLDRLTRAELWDTTLSPATFQVRSFAYDGLGRLTSSTTPEAGTVQVLKYDPVGRPLTTQDARGRIMRTVYDDAGRVLERKEDRANTTYLLARNTYDTADGSYPTRGKLIKVESFDEWGVPVANAYFDYQDLVAGRLTKQRQRFAAWGLRSEILDALDAYIEVTYGYDMWGKISRIGYPLVYPIAPPNPLRNAQTGVADVTFTRTNGWLSSIQDTNRNVTLLTMASHGYNAAGGPTSWDLGNGVHTDVTPDQRFRPSQIKVTGPGAVTLWDSGTYQYDPAGNILRIGTDPAKNDVFAYDKLGRLTNATVRFDQDNNGTPETWVETYAYDAFGNMTNRNKTGPDLTSLSLQVDAQTNRICSTNVTADPYCQAGNPTFFWDPAGNLTHDPTLFGGTNLADLVWDGQGRLLGIAKETAAGAAGIWAEQSTYDSGGLRLLRTEDTTGRTIFYVRDAAGRVLSEFIRAAGSTQPPVWSRDYYYGLGQTVAVAEPQNPEPPGNLSATVSLLAGAAYKVSLSWTDAAPGQSTSTYHVFRKALSPTPEPGYTDLTTSGITTPSYDDTVTGGGSYAYLYKVVEQDTAGHLSPDSRIINVNPGGLGPGAVSGLTATPLEGTVRLNWVRIGGADGIDIGTPTTDFEDYRVERRVQGSCATCWIDLTPLSLRDKSFVDPAPEPGVTYEYKVSTVDTSGNAAAPAPVVQAIASDPYPPPAPGGIFASSGPGGLEAALAWDPVPANSVTGYKVYRWDGSGWVAQAVLYPSGSTWVQTPPPLQATVPATATRAKLVGLTERVPVTLAVVALDGAVESVLSAPVTVRPALSAATLPGPDTFGASRDGRRTATFQVGPTERAHIYRRLEGEPGLFDLRNGLPAAQIQDADLDPCRGYVYLATKADVTTVNGVTLPNGDVSCDSATLWVDRHAIPTAPQKTMWASCPQGTVNIIKWNNLFGECVAGSDFQVDGWYLWRMGADGTPVQVGGKRTPSEVVCETPPEYPTAAYLYWIEASTHNLKEVGVAPLLDRSPASNAICMQNGNNSSACTWTPPHPGCFGCGSPPEVPIRPKMWKISNPTVYFETPVGDGEETHLAENFSTAPVQAPDPTRVAEDSALASSPEGAGTTVADLSIRCGPSPASVTTRFSASSSYDDLASMEPQRPLCNVLARRDDSTHAALSYTEAADGLSVSGLIIVGDDPPTPGSPAARGVRLTYLHSDHLGTTRLGTKEDGTVAFKTASMPFGEILQQTDDSLSRPKGFAVHARDEGSSLVYMKARSYSPGMGRFASADPGQAGALLRFPETWNGYSYVYNQPTLFVDPTGRCIWDLCIGETALAYYATLGVATIVAAAIAANPEQAQANAQNLLNSARDLTRRLPPTRQPTVSPAPNPDFNPFDFRGGGRPPDLTPKFRQIMRAGVVFGAFVGVMKIWDMTSEFWQGNPPSAPYTTDVITTVTTYHLDPETGLPVPDGPSFEHVETETETQIGPAPDNLPPAQGIENFSSRYGDNDFRWNSRRRPPKMYH